MHHRTLATAAGAAVATAALLGTSTAASATDDPEIHVGIMALLVAPSEDLLMKMLLVDDVIVGDGPELTAADVLPESDDVCGDLEVDIDLVASTATITGTGEECEVMIAAMSVFFYNGPVLEDVSLVSDDLFGGTDLFAGVESYEFGFDAAWMNPALLEAETFEELPPGGILGGSSVFALTFGEGLIEDLFEEIPDVDEDPSVREWLEDAAVEETVVEAEAEAAAPVAATPTFTG
ncbi:hypothetical protein [Demequina rhizosphaerae]|uniref:hypothetical protein n=1 Tax=Demequina rhizosphaerae TaxID=1638985 RepID=UPI000785D43F|nr:hypothetical protein [Demequina rhizosphaerae]